MSNKNSENDNTETQSESEWKSSDDMDMASIFDLSQCEDSLSTYGSVGGGVQGSLPRKSVSAATQDGSKTQKKWEARFNTVFRGSSVAATYAAAFARHKINADKPPVLSNEDMRELNIPIGHRRVLLDVVGKIRGAQEDAKLGSLDESYVKLNRIGSSFDPHASALNPICTTRNLSSGLSWKDYEGRCDSQDAFLHFVDTVMLQKGTEGELPSSFQRAFWDNKPMPFAMKAHTKYG
eukprot:PhF_6_TR29418/c0_g3_i3/m.43521